MIFTELSLIRYVIIAFVFLIEMYVSCVAAVEIDANLVFLYEKYICFVSVNS